MLETQTVDLLRVLLAMGTAEKVEMAAIEGAELDQVVTALYAMFAQAGFEMIRTIIPTAADEVSRVVGERIGLPLESHQARYPRSRTNPRRSPTPCQRS